MGIPEVSIGQDASSEKRVSPKVQQDVRKYLAEKGLGLGQLGKEQKRFVVRYIKWKRDSRWVVPLMLFCAVAAGSAGIFFFWQIREKLDPVFLPKEEIIVVNEDGTKSVRQVPPEIIAYVKDYGTLCAIFGIITGCVVYTSIAGFFGAIGMLRSLRDNRNMLEAFLPILRNVRED